MKKIILLCAIYLLGCAAYAQVTIGSGIEPEKGSLLDLKQNTPATDNTTATGGLLLPRVILTETDMLYPMFPTGYDAAAEDIAHTGLTVYNLGECDGKFARGVYNWTGAKWVQLTKNPVLTGTPAMTFTPALPANYTIEVPSGQDLRPAWSAAYAPQIALTEAGSVNAVWADKIYANGNININGGLIFSSPNQKNVPGTWGPTSLISDISIWPDAMTAADVASFQNTIPRISMLTITASPSGSPCPGGSPVTQTITLNQTHYAIMPGLDQSDNPVSTWITLRDTDGHSLDIDSNVRWQAAEASPGGTILASYTTEAPQGNENEISSYPFFYTDAFNYTSNPAGNNKYETAQVTLSDMGGKAKPLTITFMQCLGSENPNAPGVLVADPDQTSAAANNWGTSVVRHEAKPVDPDDPTKGNIYEEFYSADFGDAGRWMNTNLTAWAYDSNSGVTISLPAGANAFSDINDLVTPYWCYPKPNATVTVGESAPSTWKSQHGLLYNWSAATGNKNTAATSTVDQGQVAGDIPGPNEVETLYGKIQGICPDGWHVPSDREWNTLEKEIYNNPEDYSTYSAAELPFKSTYNSGIGAGSDGTPQSGWRSEWETNANNAPPSAIGGLGLKGRGADESPNYIGHAQAMIDVCNVESNSSNYHGRSKPVTQGGLAYTSWGKSSAEAELRIIMVLASFSGHLLQVVVRLTSGHLVIIHPELPDQMTVRNQISVL